ncbi:MAG: hypothetical protein ACYTEK_04925 [Planctomycetota bacterium]
MDMIGHQAIAIDLKTALLRVLFEQFKVEEAVVIDEEYILTVVAALDNMVSDAGNNDSCYPCHGSEYTNRRHGRQADVADIADRPAYALLSPVESGITSIPSEAGFSSMQMGRPTHGP